MSKCEFCAKCLNGRCIAFEEPIKEHKCFKEDVNDVIIIYDDIIEYSKNRGGNTTELELELNRYLNFIGHKKEA